MVVMILRWIAAGIGTLLLVGAALSFGLYIAFDAPVWGDRARSLGAWIRLAGLAWFNTEIWGRVVSAIVHWV
jgi:hypothetical protein